MRAGIIIQQQRLVSSHSLGPQFLEKAPPLKKMANLGGKNTWKMHQRFFTASEHWSKSTNPALSSGPNISLPPIYGVPTTQLDDQYKEPMVNTEII